MFGLFNKKIDTAAVVNEIENEVYAWAKPRGFRKSGRTFNRIVDEDIVQVINFQVGLAMKGTNHCLWVNLGIRVPESFERTFDKDIPRKRVYQDYHCNIRCTLGQLADGRDSFYDLRKNHGRYAADIIGKLSSCAMPVFDALNSRQAILDRRMEFPDFDTANRHLILLEEAMIYGRRGDTDMAAELFRRYYENAIAEQNEEREYILARGILQTKGDLKGTYRLPDGTFTALPANGSGHVGYLRELAVKLGIEL